MATIDEQIVSLK